MKKVVSLLALMVAGCMGSVSDLPAREDSGVDAGMPDSGPADAGRDDAGAPDAGPPDAGAPDAGPPDAGTPDAGLPDAGTPIVTCPPAALLCDDFEGDDVFDGGRWSVSSGYQSDSFVRVDSTQFAHGAHSARMHVTQTNQGFAYLVETQTFPALQDEVWGRASFMTTIDATAGHTSFISVFGDQTGLEIGISDGAWQLTFYEPGHEHPIAYSTVPLQQWVCLEWHFQRAADPLIEVFIDGGQAVNYGYSNQVVSPFTMMQLGFQNHSTNPNGTDSYFDDVAIGPTRLGCP